MDRLAGRACHRSLQCRDCIGSLGLTRQMKRPPIPSRGNSPGARHFWI